MTYRTFTLLVLIDGTAKHFEFPALDVESALNDIREIYSGRVELLQYGTR